MSHTPSPPTTTARAIGSAELSIVPPISEGGGGGGGGDDSRPSPISVISQEASPSLSARWRAVDEGRVDSFVDRARQGLHCSLFCGGTKCKHESWDHFVKTQGKKGSTIPPAAFVGLNSSWVTETIVASQRPSTTLFAKYNLIDQFKKSNLTGIFNLQEKGEHSSCGPDGIYSSSGYSYNGEKDLMPHGVGYYEFPWPDMTAPENDIVLRSVQVMASHIESNGKVLVHCHAGLGRTGLMIACYLVYAHRMPSKEAIVLVRANRPGAVQTSKQSAFVVGFEDYVNRLANIFPSSHLLSAKGKRHHNSHSNKDKGRTKDTDKGAEKEKTKKEEGPSTSGSVSSKKKPDPPLTLCTFINRQRAFLHGEAALPYRYVPRHLHLLMCRILELVRMGASSEGDAKRKAAGVSVGGFFSDTAALSSGGDGTTNTNTILSSPLGGLGLVLASSRAVALMVLDALAHTEEESEVSISMLAVNRVKEALNKGTYRYGAEAEHILDPPADATVEAISAAVAEAERAELRQEHEEQAKERLREQHPSEASQPPSSSMRVAPPPSLSPFSSAPSSQSSRPFQKQRVHAGGGEVAQWDEEDHSAVTMAFVLMDWLRRLEEPIIFPSAIDEMASFMAREDAALLVSPHQHQSQSNAAGVAEGRAKTDKDVNTAHGGTSVNGVRLPSLGRATSLTGATTLPANSNNNSNNNNNNIINSKALPPPSHTGAAFFARHFKEVERTFLRHARHTIACILSFIQSLVLIASLDTRRRYVLIERFFNAMSQYGRVSVGKIAPETRNNALRFLSQWAEAVGPNYFFEREALLRSPSVEVGVGATVLFTSPSQLVSGVLHVHGGEGAGALEMNDGSPKYAGSPSLSIAVGTGMSSGSAGGPSSPIYVASPLVGDPYCCPQEGGVAQGRIIRAVMGASVNAYYHKGGRSTVAAAAAPLVGAGGVSTNSQSSSSVGHPSGRLTSNSTGGLATHNINSHCPPSHLEPLVRAGSVPRIAPAQDGSSVGTSSVAGHSENSKPSSPLHAPPNPIMPLPLRVGDGDGTTLIVSSARSSALTSPSPPPTAGGGGRPKGALIGTAAVKRADGPEPNTREEPTVTGSPNTRDLPGMAADEEGSPSPAFVR